MHVNIIMHLLNNIISFINFLLLCKSKLNVDGALKQFIKLGIFLQINKTWNNSWSLTEFQWYVHQIYNIETVDTAQVVP